MRISDWSSDVCSSDLNGEAVARGFSDQRVTVPRLGERLISVATSTTLLDVVRQLQLLSERGDLSYRLRGLTYLNNLQRSEEHTSELQSLMRISYAVFCLKKKKSQHGKEYKLAYTEF